MYARLSLMKSVNLLRVRSPQAFVRYSSSGENELAPLTCELNKPKTERDLMYERYGKHPGTIPQPLPTVGPERDLVNFPRRKSLVYPAPTRHFFIPIEWMDFFYKKTGVTGPYVFGISLYIFLSQKELYISHGPDHKYLVSMFLYIYLFTKTPLRTYINDLMDKYWIHPDDEEFDEFSKWNKETQESMIAFEEKEQWRAEGQLDVAKAKRENVAFIQEAAYREQSLEVYNKIKRRLDYFVESEQIDKRVRQKYMIQWVIDNVTKAINPDQEKENLKKCLSDLQLLAARA